MRITLLTLQSQINKLRGEGNKALRGKAEYQTENVSIVVLLYISFLILILYLL